LDEEAQPTAEQRKRLQALRRRNSKEVDLSDIPEATQHEFKGAVRGAFYRPVKESITLRIDSDVLAWIKAKGPGYQTRINAFLRNLMQTQEKLRK
jgi:uncharacterized protein (DUF4415 family)